MKILVTGTTGFVAPHLIRYIQSLGEGHEIFGTVQDMRLAGKVPKGVEIIECELTDSLNVNAMIAKVNPDIIFHLAAQSFVYTSWLSPADTLVNNIISELNLLEAIRQFSPECIIQIAGSSEEYGKPTSTPITEDFELNPLSPYAVSKVTQEKLGFQYNRSYGLKVVLTRAFNHTGPGRDERFAEATFAKQIADGKMDVTVVRVGNLTAIRDYTDVRDVVRAYWLAANAGVYGKPMNICSGTGYTIGEVLDRLIKISGKTVVVEEDPTRMRPSDLPVLVGDCTYFKSLTGWKPEIPFEQTLKDLYTSYEQRNT